ncbi:hypothetical protein HRH25_14455 [Flavisolibacter sp. BT320]|nr:hypothetical protein [Flavisolibacter longurius]
MKKKIIIASIASAILFVGTMQFIKLNNDHLECEQVVESRSDSSGNTVIEKKHVCKEKFNF